jgi:GntR family transcriptional regulator of arabinose operon
VNTSQPNSPDSHNTPPAKHQVVRDRLAEIIRSGGFQVGCRLPADRELAARFGVSYMTARRAVGELVEADLLERRIGDGTYVRSHTQQKLSQTTINLICSSYGGSLQTDFLNLGARLAEIRAWKHHTIRLHPNHERTAVRALNSGELALVLSDDPELEGPLGKALEKAAGRAVLIGNRLDSRGVPSVLADDSKGVKIAIQHLRDAGHENIGLIANQSESHNEGVQLSIWRSSFTELAESELDKRLVVANTPRFECSTHHAYQRVVDWLKSDSSQDITALICLNHELAVGALAACRDMNRIVPEKMSLISLMDSSIMAYAYPPITCVDVDLQRHIEVALEILQHTLDGSLPPKLSLINPKLIERCSVKTLNITK